MKVWLLNLSLSDIILGKEGKIVVMFCKEMCSLKMKDLPLDRSRN
jgi:hypothetical protein